MNLFKTTEQNKTYWKQRKINWKEHYQNPEHPHRLLIVKVLKSLDWLSLIEIGVGGGANLINITKYIQGKQLGGIDINSDAIELCRKTFQGGLFKVNSADNVMLSDKSTDVVLSDMCLIYVSPNKIKKYINEIKRIARKYIVLCEFHSMSWWNRLALKINTGYNAYNWKQLLEQQGFYDIMLYKLKEQDWSGGNPQKTFAHLIVAKLI